MIIVCFSKSPHLVTIDHVHSAPLPRSDKHVRVLAIVAKSTDQGDEEKFEYDMTITGKDEAQLEGF